MDLSLSSKRIHDRARAIAADLMTAHKPCLCSSGRLITSLDHGFCHAVMDAAQSQCLTEAKALVKLVWNAHRIELGLKPKPT